MGKSKAKPKRGRKKSKKIKMRTVTIEVPAAMSDLEVRMAISHDYLVKNEKPIRYPKSMKELQVGTVFGPKGHPGTTDGSD